MYPVVTGRGTLEVQGGNTGPSVTARPAHLATLRCPPGATACAHASQVDDLSQMQSARYFLVSLLLRLGQSRGYLVGQLRAWGTVIWFVHRLQLACPGSESEDTPHNQQAVCS